MIVFARNEARYIAETLESVLSQRYERLEVHVQDGGSTDGTVEIARRYPVRVVSEPDRGQTDAAARGFHATCGDIVVFLGGDDLLLPGTVDAWVDALCEDQEAAFAYGDVEAVDSGGNRVTVLRGQPFDLDDMFWRDIVPSQGVAARRSALTSVGLFRQDLLCADWDMWLRLGARYRSVYLSKTLARYRVHPGSSSLNQMNKMARSMRLAVDSVLADPAITGALRRGRRRAAAGGYLWTAAIFALAGERTEALRMYLLGIWRHPPAVFSRRHMRSLIMLIGGPGLYYTVSRLGRAQTRRDS